MPRAPRSSGLRLIAVRGLIGVLICGSALLTAVAPSAAVSAHAGTAYAPVPSAARVDRPLVDPGPDPVVSEEPVPVPEATDPTDPTPEPEPSTQPTVEPTPEPTTAPSPESTLAPPTPEPTDPGVVVPLPAVPPGIVTSGVSLPTLLIAVAVLIASILLLWILARRGRGFSSSPPSVPRAGHGHTPTSQVLDSMTSMGQAMVGSGYPIGLVRQALEEMAIANGTPPTQVVVFPTSIVVSTEEEGRAATRAVSAGDVSYTLAQVDMIDTLQAEARSGERSARSVKRQLEFIEATPPPFTRVQRLAAYPLVSAAISVLLGASWTGVLVAGLLGIVVGALLVFGESIPRDFDALIVVGAALGVSIVGLLVARTSLDPGVLPSVVAPLVMFLPGALLTTSVIELATGHIMSGSARAAAGAMRLLLLAVGIVAAGALVGVPRIDLYAASDPLGPVAPWIAVAVFGVGIAIFQCARPRSIGWILLVLYVAYGAQVVGDLFFDGVLSALVGAAAMTPVAVLVARQRTGPPAIVSFLPAFWLLVPGALGLVGVTRILDGSDTGGSTVITTIATMIAIALGVLIGLAATSALRGPIRPAAIG